MTELLNEHYEFGKIYDLNIIEFENKANHTGENILIFNVEDIDSSLGSKMAKKTEISERFANSSRS